MSVKSNTVVSDIGCCAWIRKNIQVQLETNNDSFAEICLSFREIFILANVADQVKWPRWILNWMDTY